MSLLTTSITCCIIQASSLTISNYESPITSSNDINFYYNIETTIDAEIENIVGYLKKTSFDICCNYDCKNIVGVQSNEVLIFPDLNKFIIGFSCKKSKCIGTLNIWLKLFNAQHKNPFFKYKHNRTFLYNCSVFGTPKYKSTNIMLRFYNNGKWKGYIFKCNGETNETMLNKYEKYCDESCYYCQSTVGIRKSLFESYIKSANESESESKLTPSLVYCREHKLPDINNETLTESPLDFDINVENFGTRTTDILNLCSKCESKLDRVSKILPPIDKNMYMCSKCYIYTFSKKYCSECKVNYCSKECQLSDWPDHKKYCNRN